jgi:Ca2+-binding EF-hand superfamily protein
MGLCQSDDKKTAFHQGTMKRKATIRTEEKEKGNCLDEKKLRMEVDKIFDKYDINKDGVLEKEEVALMLKDLNMSRSKTTSSDDIESYVSNFMLKADKNDNGVIDKREFYNYYKEK